MTRSCCLICLRFGSCSCFLFCILHQIIWWRQLLKPLGPFGSCLMFFVTIELQISSVCKIANDLTYGIRRISTLPLIQFGSINIFQQAFNTRPTVHSSLTLNIYVCAPQYLHVINIYCSQLCHSFPHLKYEKGTEIHIQNRIRMDLNFAHGYSEIIFQILINLIRQYCLT